MSRFGNKGKELNPENDWQFVIIGACGAPFAVASGLYFSELDGIYSLEEQLATLVIFLVTGYGFSKLLTTAPAREQTQQVAHA